MNLFKLFIACLTFAASIVSAAEFTVSSYNVGGLSEYYDYLRAANMQKLMQERYTAEPEEMALNEKIQKVALKILFSQDPQEKSAAQREWEGYQPSLERLIASPNSHNSPNAAWNQKAEAMITNYKERPVIVYDTEVIQMLDEHLPGLGADGNAARTEQLDQAWPRMAQQIFAHQMKFDIICLQEATYLDRALFPEKYELLLTDTSHSPNGIAWNKEKFQLVEEIGNIMDKGFAVCLLDKESGKTLLVASGHLSGCNPYKVELSGSGVADSAKGDAELEAIVKLFEEKQADLMLIGMDANVTSLHPRLSILKQAGYSLDYKNYVDATCTNPNQVLNTRIDWIVIKTSEGTQAAITNIPVVNVGLNSIQTNMSDHKPVAAKITY